MYNYSRRPLTLPCNKPVITRIYNLEGYIINFVYTSLIIIALISSLHTDYLHSSCLCIIMIDHLHPTAADKSLYPCTAYNAPIATSEMEDTVT